MVCQNGQYGVQFNFKIHIYFQEWRRNKVSMFRPKFFSTMKGYKKEDFFRDFTAGVILAIIALPLSIALGIASGVSPEKGLHTAIIAGFLISFFGGSRVQIGGPTGAFMIIVYGIIMEHGLDGLILATIMAGIILIFMGLLKLGDVIKFIPSPIITGFTSGIALLIFSSQIKDFFGFNMGEPPADFLEKWGAYFSNLNTINSGSLIIGIMTILIIAFWPKLGFKIPGPLIAIIATTILINVANIDVPTIGSKFGVLSSALPKFSLPVFDFAKVRLLIGPAFTIAILGGIESLLSAVVSDGMIGGKHRSNTELIAQGIANIGSGLFGGIPATGAIARTVTNINNGGRTPVAGMVHALVLLIILVLFMPLAGLIPLASLAGVLMVVAYNMSEWREFVSFLKVPRGDLLVLVVTFLITILVDLVVAIEVGMVLAALLFMKRMSDVTLVERVQLDYTKEENWDKRELPKGVKLYEINGPFFFGAAYKFMDVTKVVSGKGTKAMIIRMKNVPTMDATALHSFEKFVKVCKRNKIQVLISRIQEQPLLVLQNSGLYQEIGADRFFNSTEMAIKYSENIA